MRLIFFLLIAANIAVYIIGAGFFGLGGKKEPPAPAPAPAVQAKPQVAPKLACVEVGPFKPDDADDAEKLFGETKPERIVKEEAPIYLVYIPPARDRATAAKMMADLKRRGLKDAAIVSGGSTIDNSISLGLYRSEDNARKAQESVKRLGIQNAQVMKHRYTPESFAFRFSGIQPDAKVMDDVLKKYPDAKKGACGDVPPVR